jgi:hypothetical protein
MQRDDAADHRDDVADRRDRQALDRDDVADHRDRLSRDHAEDIVARIHDLRDQLAGHLQRLEQFETDLQQRDLVVRARVIFNDLFTDILIEFARTREQRRAGKQDRSVAAGDRQASADDRALAAQDRFQSCGDRQQGVVEREQADYHPGKESQTDPVLPRVADSRQRLADTRDLLTRTRLGRLWGEPGAAACDK